MIIVVMGKSTQSYVRIFGLILDIVRENFTMEHFGLVSEYALTGDQPQAIELIITRLPLYQSIRHFASPILSIFLKLPK